jgi:hypothetical protein
VTKGPPSTIHVARINTRPQRNGNGALVNPVYNAGISSNQLPIDGQSPLPVRAGPKDVVFQANVQIIGQRTKGKGTVFLTSTPHPGRYLVFMAGSQVFEYSIEFWKDYMGGPSELSPVFGSPGGHQIYGDRLVFDTQNNVVDFMKALRALQSVPKTTAEPVFQKSAAPTGSSATVQVGDSHQEVNAFTTEDEAAKTIGAATIHINPVEPVKDAFNENASYNASKQLEALEAEMASTPAVSSPTAVKTEIESTAHLPPPGTLLNLSESPEMFTKQFGLRSSACDDLKDLTVPVAESIPVVTEDRYELSNEDGNEHSEGIADESTRLQDIVRALIHPVRSQLKALIANSGPEGVNQILQILSQTIISDLEGQVAEVDIWEVPRSLEQPSADDQVQVQSPSLRTLLLPQSRKLSSEEILSLRSRAVTPPASLFEHPLFPFGSSKVGHIGHFIKSGPIPDLNSQISKYGAASTTFLVGDPDLGVCVTRQSGGYIEKAGAVKLSETAAVTTNEAPQRPPSNTEPFLDSLSVHRKVESEIGSLTQIQNGRLATKLSTFIVLR